MMYGDVAVNLGEPKWRYVHVQHGHMARDGLINLACREMLPRSLVTTDSVTYWFWHVNIHVHISPGLPNPLFRSGMTVSNDPMRPHGQSHLSMVDTEILVQLFHNASILLFIQVYIRVARIRSILFKRSSKDILA